MSLLATLILLSLLALGALLIFRGIRGYRVGDHPICRRCGFDLFGAPAGATVCGECGANVKQSGSIVIGHHHRRPRLIAAGAIIAVPLVMLGGVIILEQITAVNWLKYAPTQVVIWRAKSPNSKARFGAFAELNSRFTASTLTASDLANVSDAALSCQANLSEPWDIGWGDLLEKQRAKGKLSDERWRQYLIQAANGAFGIRLRQKICHGQALPWAIQRHENRCGPFSNLQISFESSGIEWLSPHGLAPKQKGPIAAQTSLAGSGSSAMFKLQAEEFPQPIPDGLQQVHVHGSVKVGFRGSTWRIDPVVSTEIDLPGTFEILPGTRPAENNPHQASDSEGVRKSLHVVSVWLSTGRLPQMNLMVNADSSPLPLALQVLIRSAGKEILLGGFTCEANIATSDTYQMGTNWTTGNPGTIDVIFRSNPDWVGPIGNWDGENGWQGEIIFKDVPVK